jgi:hypothetical protein
MLGLSDKRKKKWLISQYFFWQADFGRVMMRLCSHASPTIFATRQKVYEPFMHGY